MDASPPSGPVPWRLGDLLLLCGLVGAGVIAVLSAWWGTSGTSSLSTQYAWVNLGVIGVVVLGTGCCIWLMIGRRALGERERLLLSAIGASQLVRVPTPIRVAATRSFVAGTGMTRYHHPDCHLVAGKTVLSSSVAAHGRAGRRPCGMCQP